MVDLYTLFKLIIPLCFFVQYIELRKIPKPLRSLPHVGECEGRPAEV